MKKRTTLCWLLVTALLCAAVFAATTALLGWYHAAHPATTSAIYERYAHREGIKATFFPKHHIAYKVDHPSSRFSDKPDYQEVDITVLKADDSLAYVELQREWGRSEESIVHIMAHAADADYHPVSFRPKGFPERVADTVIANNDVMVFFPDRYIYVFLHPTTEEQAWELHTIIAFNNKIDIKL